MLASYWGQVHSLVVVQLKGGFFPSSVLREYKKVTIQKTRNEITSFLTMPSEKLKHNNVIHGSSKTEFFFFFPL